MKKAIRESLKRAGMARLPERDNEPLAPYGLDSLKLLFVVVELEREFELVFPVGELNMENFASVDSIAEQITGLKAPRE